MCALQSYQELCKKHPSFRERSENADLAVSVLRHVHSASRHSCPSSTWPRHGLSRLTCVEVQVEVSLQPWIAFKPDGVILFSDILTPLSGMNIPFDIAGGEGPIIHDPIRTMEARCTPCALFGGSCSCRSSGCLSAACGSVLEQCSTTARQ